MENLYLNIYPELVYYPIVDFNYLTGECVISGESYMEETYKFYLPVINWLKNYIAEKKPVVFTVKLTYFNTSSSRMLLEMLLILKQYKESGGDVNVVWFYKSNDPDMLMDIESYIKETGLAIEAVKIDKM
jgi:hypothetical protein